MDVALEHLHGEDDFAGTTQEQAVVDGELDAVSCLVDVGLAEEDGVGVRELIEEGVEGEALAGLAVADGDAVLEVGGGPGGLLGVGARDVRASGSSGGTRCGACAEGEGEEAGRDGACSFGEETHRGERVHILTSRWRGAFSGRWCRSGREREMWGNGGKAEATRHRKRAAASLTRTARVRRVAARCARRCSAAARAARVLGRKWETEQTFRR